MYVQITLRGDRVERWDIPWSAGVSENSFEDGQKLFRVRALLRASGPSFL